MKNVRARGFLVPEDRGMVVEKVRQLIQKHNEELRKEYARMRQERTRRWKDSIPRIWQKSPGRVYSWLKGRRAAWGQAPLVGADGKQLVSLEEVDREVKGFWVDRIWRREDPAKAEEAWRNFQESQFAPFVPRPAEEWPTPVWTASLVKDALRSVKRTAAPGTWDVPIALWLSLPTDWFDAVARLLAWVQDTGEWPSDLLHAYVALIPKGQGTEVTAQRPITVLELCYRIFAKAVVTAWSPTLQRQLGEAAMGFRMCTGTTQMGQFVQDIVEMRRRDGQEVWLASFDVVKCYDSLPWWALWGVMELSGASRKVVRAFRKFYEALTRHFRYGCVDGSPWQALNGLAQGAPCGPLIC